MVFSSVTFIFAFLPLIAACHFLLHRQLRDALLLVASLVFYLAGEATLWWVLPISLLLNYAGGLLIAMANGRTRVAVLFLAVVANVSILFVFKYANFALAPLAQDGALGVLLKGVALPLGVSFFTFHGISYVVDVYRGTAFAQANIVRFGLYFLFFPQLIAGPIVRYHSIADQFQNRNPQVDDLYEGFRRFTVGLGKKVLIADPLSTVADAMFALPVHELDIVSCWVGAVAYALQIYFDFSGYSDMAVGLARMFGLRFPENFNYPYIAVSITDFWRRWHISLSSWFRDYVYIPLGGNRRGAARTYLNLVTVFLLCGLWHGAGWTFVAWGAYFGAFLILERMLARPMARLPLPIQHAYALAVILFGWVIFRSPSLSYAAHFLLAMVTPKLLGGHVQALFSIELGTIIIFAIGILCSTPLPSRTAALLVPDWRAPALFRETLAAGAIVSAFVVSLSFVVASTYSPFIYFRF